MYVCVNEIVCAVQMKVRVWSVYVCICVYSRQPLMGIMCGVSSTDAQKHANPHPPCTVRINTRARTQTHRHVHTKMHTERASVSELRTTPRGGKAPVSVCARLWVCVKEWQNTHSVSEGWGMVGGWKAKGEGREWGGVSRAERKEKDMGSEQRQKDGMGV